MGIEIKFESNVDEVMRKIGSVSQERMHESVNEVRNRVLDTLSGSRSGRIYKVPGTQREYQASAPGEAPAVQTANLRQNIKGGVEVEKEVIGFVGTDVPYGPMLEYGTSRMAARPWLRTSFEKSMEKVREILTRTWF